MVELIYKQTQESFNTIIHYPYNPIKKDYKIGGISTATKIDGYTTNKLYYFTQETVLTDEENFKENYGNPLAEVSNGRRMVVVEKEGDKVRLSIYRHHKFRKAGKKYFAKAYDRFYLTYNLKTNNVYCTKSMKEVGYRGRRSVRANNFQIIDRLFDYFEGITYDTQSNNFLSLFIRTIDPENTVKIEKHNFVTEIMKTFISRNDIKGPNTMLGLLSNYYPGKKLLKKNKNNLVHAILDGLGIKTKYYNTLFNTYYPEMEYVIMYNQLLGPKYVRTVDKKFYDMETTPYPYWGGKLERIDLKPIPSSYDITDEDRKNIVKVINDFTNLSQKRVFNINTRERNLSGLINDHLRIMDKLKKFEPNTRFRARTFDEFNNEHINYSEKYDLYRNSEEIYYNYGPDLVNALKEGYKGSEYILLTNDMEYINESTHQSNCVRTYIDKFKSIIISVRKGKDRVTTEFNYKGQCIQRRGRFNEPVSENMLEYVEHLGNIIQSLYLNNKLEPATVKIYNKVTGNTTTHTLKELEEGNFTVNRGHGLFDDFVNDELDLMFLG